MENTPSGTGVDGRSERPIRVLVVEDEPVVRALIEELLGDTSLVSAGSLREARDRLADETELLDVALLDKNLPDGSGLSLVQEVKQGHPECEVLLITAYPSLESAVQALEVGVFDYLTKPFRDPEDVLLKVRNAAGKARLARERMRLEHHLAESEERYRRLFEASSEAVLVVDAATGRVVDANRAAVDLYGWPSDLAGVASEELRAPDVPPAGEDWPMGDRLRLVSRWDRRGDGSRIAVEVSTARVTLGGRPCLVEVIRDVTERRRLETELREAQKMESLGRLAGGVVHDLNNILVVLINCSTFLKDFIDGAPTGERRELAEQDIASIVQATAGAQRLARQLLAFGRRHRPAPEVLDANDVVTETAQLLRRVLEENIAFEVRLGRSVPPVEIDRGQLEQVIINLALNARDAMPDGGRLTVATAPSAGGGLLLTVSDSGAGIAEEIRERIFEPFFTTKGPERGTGLGLATVHRVVREAQGAITVASRLGLGTTFSIELPRSSGRMVSRRSVTDEIITRRRGEQVLLVEDDAAVRGAVARVLRRAGHGVREASTAAQAMERAREGTVELLVTDVILPDRSGSELVRELRELNGAGLPVVYMTGYTPSVELAPGDGWLPKPFTPERLLECIAKVLASQPPVERCAETG